MKIRRKFLVALILAILAVSIFLYVFFEMPLVRGVRREPVGGQATGFVWYVSFDYEGIRYNLVFIPGHKVSVPMPPYEATTPKFAPMHKVPDDEDFKQFEHFIKEELRSNRTMTRSTLRFAKKEPTSAMSMNAH